MGRDKWIVRRSSDGKKGEKGIGEKKLPKALNLKAMASKLLYKGLKQTKYNKFSFLLVGTKEKLSCPCA